MFTLSKQGRRAATFILALAVSTAVSVTAEAASQDDTSCLTVSAVVAVQMPDTSVLLGSIDVPDRPIIYGQVSTRDGNQTVQVGEGAQFELPLGTQSDEWYVSYLRSPACEAHLAPTEATLVKVRNFTRIRPNSPDLYVPYGQRITVSGVLEGWTQETGWMPLASRQIDVWRSWNDPSPTHVPTDATGTYIATVRALEVGAAGSGHFAGDHTWLSASGNAQVKVHVRLSAHVSDTTPAVGQRIRVTGRVAPGNLGIRLEQLRDGTWTIASATVIADTAGNYVLRYRPTAEGTVQMRVRTDGIGDGGSSEGIYPYLAVFPLNVHQ